MITALVGWHDHPVSARPVRHHGDVIAASLALTISPDARLLTAGAMPDLVARDYLALGARHIDILDCDADPASLLIPALAHAALVFTGLRGENDFASGVLPYAVAEGLRRPLIENVVAVARDGAGWIVTQALPKGARRRLALDVPAVLAVDPRAAVAPRHSHRDAQAGTIARHPLAAPAAPAPWQRVASRQLLPLRAARSRSGHARMLGAIAAEPAGTGAVLAAGSAADKARAILDYLQQHSLLGP
ncbi:MAG TPA: electron transfer flavoprotein subunit beta/FixA family protein [Albitalea sp.]|uniref:electron transfer flavoprotein subunit beta/FixA family protein n=1 Tax=Piscinibacter sp. TaxID=1903157 RepID=UPI002ED4EC40